MPTPSASSAPATPAIPRYADPGRCPDCRHLLPGGPRTACPACGLSLQGRTAADLFATLQAADRMLAELRRERPAPLVAGQEDRVPVPPLRADTSRATWSVPAVLLALGALCLLVGAVVFLAVAWSVLGVGGRTAVLIGLTTVGGAATVLCSRRDLRGAAEALALVTGVFVALDVAGGYAAGWLGHVTDPTAVLVGSSAVAVALATGGAAMVPSRVGPLLTPQLLATLAAAVAGVAALVRFPASSTTTAPVAVVALVGAALAGRRTGQRLLTAGLAGVAGLMWLVLVGDGARHALDRPDLSTALTASEVASLVAAAAIAAGLAGAPVGTRVRQAALVASCWTGGAAMALTLVVSPTGLAAAAAAGALACAVLGLVSPRRSAASAFAFAAGGYAAVALGTASTTAVRLATSLVLAVDERGGLLARAHPDLGRLDLPAGWTVPVAALAAAGAALAFGHGRWAVGARTVAWTAAPVALVVLAVPLLCWVPSLLLAVVVALAVATLHLLAARRHTSGGASGADLVAAGCWLAAAGALATYDPWAATAVSALGAGAATVVGARGSRAALVAAPVLAGATALAVGWLAGWQSPGTALAVVGVSSLHAVVAGAVARRHDATGEARAASYLAAVTTALVATGVGTSTTGGGAADWLVANLVVLGCAAGVVAILERRREAAWVAATVHLVATWVRLGDTDVAVAEAYSLPLAGVLLAFGAWTLVRDPESDSVRTLTPGLLAGLVPSLVLVAQDPVGSRALLVATGCGAAVLAGAAWRLRGPLLVGAGTGAALAVVEIAPYHDAVPRWLLLGLAGLLLLGAGVRWEHLATLGRREWGRIAELR